MLHKEHIFVDFRDWTLFMVKELWRGGGQCLEMGVKFSKPVEMGVRFSNFSKILEA